jgi:hypothetical protein
MERVNMEKYLKRVKRMLADLEKELETESGLWDQAVIDGDSVAFDAHKKRWEELTRLKVELMEVLRYMGEDPFRSP